MSVRLALTSATIVGEAVTVEHAARLLGCDSSTVRKLLKRRQLAGHRVGLGDRPGGVRVDLASVEAYKARHAFGATDDDEQPLQHQARGRRRRSPNPAHDEAVAQLRAWGIQV